MLCVENLSKKYKKTVAADNVSFKLEPGEISVLLGPNGAGKSTTIKSISGLITYKGNITICGFNNRSIDAKKAFSYVPEIPHNFEYLTVMEHCRFIAKAYKAENSRENIEKYLEIFEMSENANKIGKELSKGMHQKLSIICALITNPKVIMFDEPLVGLDPKAIRECKNIFLELKEKGTTVLISSHIIDTLDDLWDKALIMSKGKLILQTSRAEFESEKPGMNLEELFFKITEAK